jgi:hypothetical protein
VPDDYFDNTMITRQRLLWAIATRRQLERWEPIVATLLRDELAGRRPANGADVWSAEIERHFALVAARNLLRALALPPASSVSIEATLRDELIEGRNLNEHWPDNMPVFNVTPRAEEPPHKTGKRFAERNPDRGPYGQSNWNNKKGALLLPNVSAPALHQLLDAVEADVLPKNAALSEYMPPRAPSPWIHENGEWWPKTDEDAR